MPESPPRRRCLTWTALWAIVSFAAPAAAAGRPASGLAAVPDTVQLVVVSERPWTAAVTVTLSFAGGYGDDPPGAEGTAWLLGRVLERAVAASLAETGAVAAIEVEGERTWVTLLTTSGDWAAAYRILTHTLFTDPLDAALAAETRSELSGQVLFQRDAPVRAFELAARRMLLGAARARPAMGAPSSVSGMTVEALEATRARIYRMDEARLAVVGAVEPAEAASIVGAHRTMARRAAQAWVVEGTPMPPRTPGWAWETGGRTSVADDITNNWIRAAYPFEGTTSRRPMEFLAHVIGEQLGIDLPAPGLISRRVEVRELPGGPVVQVTIAAQWPTVRAWEQRIVDIVDHLSAGNLSQDDLNRQYRRFRSARALATADPEREGRRLLIEAESDGGPGEPRAAMEGLSSEEVQRAAAGLGEPRVLVYGPGGPPS